MAPKSATKAAAKPAAKAPRKSTSKAAAKSSSKTPNSKPTSAKPTRAKTPNVAKTAAVPNTSATSLKASCTAKKTPKVSLVKEAQAASVGAELKKKELLDLVVARSGVKKKFAKPAVEAMLDILGEAIADERSLNLQPMGRIMPKRTKDAGKNRVVIARIRQSKERVEEAAASNPENQAVAKAAE